MENHFMEGVQPYPTGLLEAESITLGSILINIFMFQAIVSVKR